MRHRHEGGRRVGRPPTDRRRSKRVSLGGRVQCVQGGRMVMATLEDVSEGGARIRARGGLDPARSVKVFITPAASQRRLRRVCLLGGRVAWHRGDLVGLQFVDPPDDMQTFLRDLVKAERPDFWAG